MLILVFLWPAWLRSAKCKDSTCDGVVNARGKNGSYTVTLVRSHTCQRRTDTRVVHGDLIEKYLRDAGDIVMKESAKQVAKHLRVQHQVFAPIRMVRTCHTYAVSVSTNQR